MGQRFLADVWWGGIAAIGLFSVGCTSTVDGTGPTPGGQPDVPQANDAPPDSAPPEKRAAPAAPALPTSPAGPPVAPARSVAGQWRGRLANDRAFLDLTQDGPFVSGDFCEYPNRDCEPLTDAVVNGDRFTARFRVPSRGIVLLVDVVVHGDGRTLAGTVRADDCACAGEAVCACSYALVVQRE